MDFGNLEKAIDILTNPMAHTDQEVKKQANDYLISFVSDNYANWRDFFVYFTQTESKSTRYWILQALCDIAKDYWNALSGPEEVQFVNAAFEFIRDNSELIIPVHHFWKRYSYFYSLLIRNAYPQQWKSVFDQLVSLVQESDKSMDFLKFTFGVLEQINDELIEREAGTTQEDLYAANKVKDGMRLGDVEKIVNLCKTVLDNYTQLDKEIVVGAIDTLADLIDWNDLALFESSFEVITQLLDVKDYQQNALYCFYSFMHKGMDPGRKVELIRSIDIISKIKSFNIDAEDYELCQSISDIISKLGLLILEIIETSDANAQYVDDAQSLLLDLLVLNIMFLECEDIKSSQYIVRFINAMVLYLKRIDALSETLAEILVKIQDVWIQKIEYPEWCTFEDGKLGEDEENFRILRGDLVNLYSNTLLITELKTRALEIIEAKLISLKSNIRDFSQNQIELPLFLLSQMHSTIMRDDKDLANPLYQKLIAHFLEVDFLAANSKIVSILYFEIWVKFASYFVIYPDAIPNVLESFMSEKGVLSPWAKLASRSSFFLLRFIDRLRPQLSSWAELVFVKAQEVIKLAEAGGTQLMSNDIENFYEIIGNMLEGFKMPPAKARETLEYYFELVLNKINSMPSKYLDGIVDFIRRLNMLVKSLTMNTASESKDLFIQMSANLYKYFEIYINNPIQECIVFVQKSLALVGTEMIEGVNTYIECLLNAKTQVWLDNCIRLVNYAGIERDEEGLQLVDKHLITIFDQLENVGFPESDHSDSDKDKISVFGKFMKLLLTCTQKNSLVLLGPNWGQIFEKIIRLLIFMIRQSVEKHFRKEALMILRTILIEFSGWTVNQIKAIHIGDKEKIEERKISDNSEYESVWRFLLEVMAKESFDIFQYLNPSDPVDVNWIYLISLIHVVLINIDPSFASQYQNNITAIKPDIEFNELALNIQQFSEDKLKAAVFKRNITKLFRTSK